MLKKLPCVFCADGFGTTADHIPPRSFFPRQLPRTNLIKVPCCADCHKISKVDDAIVRNLIVSLEDTESLPLVKKHLLPKRDRSFQYSDAEVKRLMALTRLKDIFSPAGIYLGSAPAFDFYSPIMRRFVERMSRGLLWEAFEVAFFPGKFPYRVNFPLSDLDYLVFQKFGVVRKVHDAFGFGVRREAADHPAWVLFNFYGNLEFFVRVRAGVIETE